MIATCLLYYTDDTIHKYMMINEINSGQDTFRQLKRFKYNATTTSLKWNPPHPNPLCLSYSICLSLPPLPIYCQFLWILLVKWISWQEWFVKPLSEIFYYIMPIYSRSHSNCWLWAGQTMTKLYRFEYK